MTGNSDDKLNLDSRPFGSMKDLKAINLDYSSLKTPLLYNFLLLLSFQVPYL